MKGLISITGAIALIGAITAGIVGCEPGGGEPAPAWGCWVFVTTTQNPTLLLAKSGYSGKEALAVQAKFESQYGKKNVMWGYDFPIDGYTPDGQMYKDLYPDAVPNCYEITITIDFSNGSMPSKSSLLSYGFRGVRIDGNIAICKEYLWAFTEEGAGYLIPAVENGYNSYIAKEYGGTIVGITTIANLGPYVENRPITF